jgi:hypothetical protein
VKTLKRIEKEQDAKSQIGESYYLNKHMLEEIKINFELINEHLPLDTVTSERVRTTLCIVGWRSA